MSDISLPVDALEDLQREQIKTHRHVIYMVRLVYLYYKQLKSTVTRQMIQSNV